MMLQRRALFGSKVDYQGTYVNVLIDSDSTTFQLYITNKGSSFGVDWGDGSEEILSSSTISHLYNSGSYQIRLDDGVYGFKAVNGSKAQITELGFGPSVIYMPDGAFNGCANIEKIAYATNVGRGVGLYNINNVFVSASHLNYICGFPSIVSQTALYWFPEKLYDYIGEFTSLKSASFAVPLMYGFSGDKNDIFPSYTQYIAGVNTLLNYKVRRFVYPESTGINNDAFYAFPNVYGIYLPKCTSICSCLTRNSSRMTNNPLGVTHVRFGHLSKITVFPDRSLCWGGSENYLGVFMVDMTRSELTAWLAGLSNPNFISQSALTNKSICTDDPEWDAWDAWFVGGMELNEVPQFPLNR